MSLRDRRVKRCPNAGCKEYGKTNFDSSKQFCSTCGTELVFVCKKCHSKIVDEGPEHILCATCEAAEQDKRDKHLATAKKAGEAIAAGISLVLSYVTIPQEVKDKAAEVAKGVIDLVRK